ncbi:MAG: hypothetical protein U9R51_04545 [Actinomycetota bacterium]|nr:hypothetical protein [Actinomycetota bacterium]
MRILTVALITVLALVSVSCSNDSAESDLTEAELAWCADPGDFSSYDAIWDTANDLGVDTVGHFMLDEAGIETDVHPDDLSAEDLTEEEITALIEVGDEFENGDEIWLEYLATDDGTKACQTAYESASG